MAVVLWYLERMTKKSHWNKVRVARMPSERAISDEPADYAGTERLSELSWFKKGEASRRWPARFMDESGAAITSAEEIDWSGFNELDGLSAELEFAALVGKTILKGLGSNR